MIVKNAWFRFNGIDSRTFGIRVTAMPATTRAERRVEKITVDGRSGTLHADEEAFNSYDKTMECAIIDREKVDEIAAWLNGSGDMVFSTEPDKVYRVLIANKIDINGMMQTFQRFQVIMECQPFKKSVNAFGDRINLTEGTSIYNKGTWKSQPKITIYGSGNITLKINSVAYGLKEVSGSITIDSEMMEVYKGSDNENSKYTAAEFPFFAVGRNDISWSGNVQRVEIEPNWRWI